MVLHAYRYRWGFVDGGAAYAEDDAQLMPAPLLDGVGHFPQREAPGAVADAIVRFCEHG